ncbi:hypothetical protein Fmac_031966 [Flemingia macrophylla]|uniref:Uncharacterized protein n=1 Tax=Flemingia macrophylla TaxID=520843 RepID=A0ABD1L3K0_9FABA
MKEPASRDVGRERSALAAEESDRTVSAALDLRNPLAILLPPLRAVLPRRLLQNHRKAQTPSPPGLAGHRAGIGHRRRVVLPSVGCAVLPDRPGPARTRPPPGRYGVAQLGGFGRSAVGEGGVGEAVWDSHLALRAAQGARRAGVGFHAD